MPESKEIIRCQKCDKPLGQKFDDYIRIATNNKGAREYIIIRFQHNDGGIISLECEKCKKAARNFMTVVVKNFKQQRGS